MRLTSVQIQNFKGFEERSFEFDPNFNLFVGENGRGKTSALEAITCALASWVPLNSKALREQLKDALRITSPEPGVFEDQVPLVLKAHAIGELGRGATWSVVIERRSALDKPDDYQAILAKSRVPRFMTRWEEVMLPIFAYYHSSRSFTRGTAPDWNQIMQARPTRSSGYDNWHDCQLAGKSLAEWLGREEAIAFQEKKERPIYDTVRKAILGCMPGSDRIWFDVKSAEPVVRWIGGKSMKFSQLSDGQRSILTLVGDLARRTALLNPRLENDAPSQTPGVVLIDELDLHLHPRWQRQIVDDLKRTFPKIQFIATSHSPFIIQSLEPGELINLDENRTELEYWNESLEDIAEEVMGVEQPQRSHRYQKMLGAAEEYFRLLHKGEATSAELDKAKEKYMELSAPLGNAPAQEAYLEIKRLTAGKNGRKKSS